MRIYNKYQVALEVLIRIKHQLNIVVVGANDGKTRDPIYNFAMKRSGATKILLVEPNELLLPYLNRNYSSHPSHQIANCAIGEEGTLTLYAIKQEAWESFQPAYAKKWPFHRAATGLTSAFRSHLEKAVKNQGLNPDAAIGTMNIPPKKLKTLLEELKWPVPIHVLQIDAEGYDDVVIYNSNLAYSKPTLIYFESHNMSAEKMGALKQYLVRQKYSTYSLRDDVLAVSRRINPTCILLNFIMIMHSSLELMLRVKRKLFGVTRGLVARREGDRI